MRHRKICRNDTGFQARAKKGVQDDFADATDLAQTRKQQQWRLEHIAIDDRMHTRGIAKPADLLGDHTT